MLYKLDDCPGYGLSRMAQPTRFCRGVTLAVAVECYAVLRAALVVDGAHVRQDGVAFAQKKVQDCLPLDQTRCVCPSADARANFQTRRPISISMPRGFELAVEAQRMLASGE